jgi:hypothetical protein
MIHNPDNAMKPEIFTGLIFYHWLSLRPRERNLPDAQPILKRKEKVFPAATNDLLFLNHLPLEMNSKKCSSRLARCL